MAPTCVGHGPENVWGIHIQHQQGPVRSLCAHLVADGLEQPHAVATDVIATWISFSRVRCSVPAIGGFDRWFGAKELLGLVKGIWEAYPPNHQSKPPKGKLDARGSDLRLCSDPEARLFAAVWVFELPKALQSEGWPGSCTTCEDTIFRTCVIRSPS